MKDRTGRTRRIGTLAVNLAAVFLTLQAAASGAHAQDLDYQQVLQRARSALDPEIAGRNIRWLTEEVERRQQICRTDCAPAVNTVAGLLRSEAALGQALAELTPYCNDLLRKIDSHLEPFDQLVEEYEELKADAAGAGALVPDEIWEQYRAAKGKGILIPAVLADPGNPGLMAQIRKFKEREYRITSVDWTQALERYRQEIGTEVDSANGAWEKKLKALAVLEQRYYEFRQQLETLFEEGKYEHCLGEIARRRQLHYGSGFSDPGVVGTELTDLPGMAFEPPTREKIRARFKSVIPFAAPEERGAPPPLHYYKDPSQAPQRFVARAEARLEGERYMLVAEAVEGPRYVCEVASQYALWNVAQGMVHPLRHFADSRESWDQVLYNVGKEYTWDMAEGVLKAGVELVEEGTKGTQAGGEAFVRGLEGLVDSPQGALETIQGVFQGADQALGKINAALEGANPMYDPDRPGANASPEEWLRYAGELNGRAVSTKDAASQVKDATKWFNEHMVDNANRALTVYLAARTGGEAFEAAGGGWIGTLKAGQAVTGTDILEQVHGGLKAIKSAREVGFRKFEKSTGTAQTVVDEVNTAERILENPARVDAKTLSLAEENSSIAKVTERLRERENAERQVAEIEEETRRRANKPEPPPSGHETPVRETIEVVDGEGNQVTLDLGEELGKGGGSEASVDAKNSAYVVRRTELTPNGQRAHAHDELGREILERDFDDNRAIRVAKREAVYSKKAGDPLDPFAREAEHVEVVENLSSENGFVDVGEMAKQGEALTDGQRLAIEMAHRELNSKGAVWLDNTAANYRLEKLPGEDRWRLVVLDTGGIYKVKGGDPARAAEAQRIFDTKMRQVVEEGIEGQGGYMNVAFELARENIEFELPEGADSPAYAVKERTRTGLEGMAKDKLEEAWRAEETATVQEILTNSQEFQDAQERLGEMEEKSSRVADRLKQAEEELAGGPEDERHIYLSGENPEKGYLEPGESMVELPEEGGNLLDIPGWELPGDVLGDMKLPEIDFDNLGDKPDLLF